MKLLFLINSYLIIFQVYLKIETMRTIITSALLLCTAFLVQAQKGKAFPKMACKNLDEKEVVLPLKGTGKYTLLGLAYSKKSEQALQTWYKPIYSKFIAVPPKNSLLADEPYDVNLYFVPMFTGVNAAAAGAATKQMQEGTDAELKDHILIFKGKLNDYKEALNFSKKDEPYFYVLDKNGVVVYMTSGTYSAEKLGPIEDIIDEF